MGQTMAAELTQDALQSLIRCDGDKYFWLPRPRELFKTERDWKRWNSRFAGKETLTTLNQIGYRQVAIFGQYYLAHRLIWLYHYGAWPKGEIDHVNGDRSDNRLENLRDVPRKINGRNQRKLDANTSGHTGVSWCKQTGKWRATIKVDYRNLHLGRFSQISNAIAARKDAEKLHGFHANHGRSL